MAKLVITLLDGFDNDAVVLTLAGREVYRSDGVTTRLLLGFAEQIDLDVPPGDAILHVVLPGRSVEADFRVNCGTDVTVLVSVDGSRLRFQTHPGLLGYT